MASARAVQCPGCQEFDTQYEYKEKHKYGKLISGYINILNTLQLPRGINGSKEVSVNVFEIRGRPRTWKCTAR